MSNTYVVTCKTKEVVFVGPASDVKDAVLRFQDYNHVSVSVLNEQQYAALQYSQSPEGLAEKAERDAQIMRDMEIRAQARKAGVQRKDIVLSAERTNYVQLKNNMRMLANTKYDKCAVYKHVVDVLTNHADDGVVTVPQAACIASWAAELRSLAQQS